MTSQAANGRDADQLVHGPSASVIFVAYGVETLDLTWIPDDAPVLVVHNDLMLAESSCRPGCSHIYPGSNLGFGKGVNTALKEVTTPRVIVCNPDAVLTRTHWDVLVEVESDEMVTVPLVDENGVAKASAFPYPISTLLVLGMTRAVQAAPAGSLRRKVLTRLLGEWGQERRWSVAQPPGRYPLSEWWASGAVLSLHTDLLRSVGGFDPDYFLYFEDTDLSRRIANKSASACLVIADAPAALHRVGGSARTEGDRKRAEAERWRSACRYASGEKGLRWKLAGSFLAIGATVTSPRAGDR